MRAVFIGGAPRSGTTFLASLLGGHPECIVTPESSFKVDALIAHTSRGDEPLKSIAIRSLIDNARFRSWDFPFGASDKERLSKVRTASEAMFMLARTYARALGREDPSVWIDHTPSNIRYVDRFRQHFLNARFVHLIRDGRAVSASVLPLKWGPNTIVASAREWLEYVAAGLAAESVLSNSSICRIQYESLVAEPVRELRRLCEFLGLEFRDEMIAGKGFEPENYSRALHPLVGQPPRVDRVSAWRDNLSSREVEIFEALTGDVLICLGYDLEFGWKAKGPTLSENLRMYLKEGWYRARNRRNLRKRLERYSTNSGAGSGGEPR